MKIFLATVVSLFFITACAPTTNFFDVYTQEEFNASARSLNLAYIVRVQTVSSITDKGIGNRIQSFAQTAADNNLEVAKQYALGMCAGSCIVSSINGQITPQANKLIKLAKEKKEIDRQEKVETELGKLKTDKKLKQTKISLMKKDCEELGFKNNTEAMGNCVLKLMELEGKNFNSSGSNASNEIVDIEKQKLQAQREALSLQQEQLKAEQARVAQERRKAIQRNANKSIQQGKCLMNGGSTWDCM